MGCSLSTPIAVKILPSVDPPLVLFLEDSDLMACPSILINGSVTVSSAVRIDFWVFSVRNGLN